MQNTLANVMKTILFIDDEDYLTLSLSKLLIGEGYNVLIVRNCKQAIRTYNDNLLDIDLILMDITMSDMEGIDAYIELLKLAASMPILLMSVYSQASLNCLEYPYFIRKPMHPLTLTKTIKNIFRPNIHTLSVAA